MCFRACADVFIAYRITSVFLVVYVNVDVTACVCENMLMTLQCFQSLLTRTPRCDSVRFVIRHRRKASECVMNGEIIFRTATESEGGEVIEFLREHFFKVKKEIRKKGVC